ncbi:MAG: zinc-ribbon domain containing protein [Dehalococcoidales bacterium]|nr:zinc-ribbon domain containing protein [Dehalococcoidales bacterium]
MTKYSDITITCNQCGKKFVFSEDEQEFYRGKGYSPPLRCKQCRSARQQSTNACTGCSNKLIEGSPLYCAACYINVHLEFEQKTRELKNLLHETESRLQAVEAEKSRIEAETSSKIKAIEDERKLIAALNDKIEAMDRNQNNLKDLLLRLINEFDNHRRDSNIVETLKTFFRPGRSSPA